MNPGMTIDKVLETIRFNADRKEDFIVPADQLHVNGNTIYLNDAPYSMTTTMNQQLATWLRFPKSTYDRFKDEYPEVFNMAANAVLRREGVDKPRMLRTFKPGPQDEAGLQDMGKARALLSSRFFRLDHDRIAQRTLPIIAETNLSIKSMNVSDEDFHIQASDERSKYEVRVGEWVEMGIHLRDNEVGRGMLTMDVWLYDLACTNGMIRRNMSKTRRHVGETLFGEEGTGILSQEAAAAATEATALAFRDHLNYLVSEGFEKYIAEVKAAANTDVRIPNKQLVVQKMSQDYGLTQDEQEKLTQMFYRDPRTTIWSIANHVTELANDRAYEPGIELQEAGGNLLDLPTSKWASISNWTSEADIPRTPVFA